MAAVDEDVADAFGVAVGAFEGGGIANGLGIEDDDIGEGAGGEASAAGESEASGVQAGQLVDGGFEREDLFVADILAEGNGRYFRRS